MVGDRDRLSGPHDAMPHDSLLRGVGDQLQVVAAGRLAKLPLATAEGVDGDRAATGRVEPPRQHNEGEQTPVRRDGHPLIGGDGVVLDIEVDFIRPRPQGAEYLTYRRLVVIVFPHRAVNQGHKSLPSSLSA